MNDSGRHPAKFGAIAKYAFLASLFSFAISGLLAFSFQSRMQNFDLGNAKMTLLESIFYVSIIGPIIETLVMGFLISCILKPVLKNDYAATLASAALFAILHGIFDVYWGIIIFFIFIIFSHVYLKFLRYDVKSALLAAVLTHAIHNFGGVLASAAGL